MRPIVTLLCIATIVAFGYAVAGMGGYLLGHGNLTYIIAGLLGGACCGGLALYLYKKHPEAFYNDIGAE